MMPTGSAWTACISSIDCPTLRRPARHRAPRGRGKTGPKIAWDISKQGGQMPEGPVRDSPGGPMFSQRRCLADHALQIRDLRHPGHLPAAGQLRRQIVQPTGLPQGGAGNRQKVRQIGRRWPAALDRGAPTAWIKGQHAVRADPEDFAPHLAVDGPGPWHLPPSDRLHCRRGQKDDDSRHAMSDAPMRAGTLGPTGTNDVMRRPIAWLAAVTMVAGSPTVADTIPHETVRLASGTSGTTLGGAGQVL